jgi:hypothetical protein
MTQRDFDTILDQCLARMAAGESPDACLEQYPQYSAALRPLLSVAADLHALPRPEPSAAAVQAGRQRMLAAVREQKRARGVSISPLAGYAAQVRGFFVPTEGMQIRHVLRFAVAMVLVLLVGTNLAVVASAGSIPGDPLYGVKRSWEEARLALTLREQDREQLLDQLVERRQDEVREMIQEGREGTLDLEGTLRASGEKGWSVNGLTFLLSEKTIVDGQLEPGARAWVRAQLSSDGSLVALLIRMRTRARLLSPAATEPGVTPDDMPDGRHTPAVTPMPQRTPEPTRPLQATETPPASATPHRGETPEPAPTGNADHTPGPAETREPEDTPGPVRTGEDDHTPEAAETHQPEHTPEPEETHEPEHTPEPDETHEPEHTPGPAETHEPDGSPEPTGEPRRTPEPTRESEHTPEAGRTPGAANDRD